MSDKKVLVVEDEKALSEVFNNMLNVFELESSISSNATEAKRKVEKSDFDYIIIDLTLPDQPGIDLYKELVKAHPKYKGKVVFTSGFNLDEEIEEVIQRDNLTFLPKPFSIDKFKEIIDKW